MSPKAPPKAPPRLDDEIRDLYRGPLGAFTPQRQALAKRLKQARDDREAEVKQLPKPPLSAWAVNQLFAQEPQAMAALVGAGERARAAQRKVVAGGDAAALCQAIESARAEAQRLTERGVEILTAAERAPGEAIVERLRADLESLAFNPATAPVAARGWLDGDLEAPGFEVLAGLQLAAAAGRPAPKPPQPAASRSRPAESKPQPAAPKPQPAASRQPSPARPARSATVHQFEEGKRASADRRERAAQAEAERREQIAEAKAALKRAEAAVEERRREAERLERTVEQAADIAAAAEKRAAQVAQRAAEAAQEATRTAERAEAARRAAEEAQERIAAAEAAATQALQALTRAERR